MPHILIPVVGGRIDHLILHYKENSEGTAGTALTIVCPTKIFLEEVYGVFHTMDDNEIYNHDEGVNRQFHDQLHTDMQAAMNTNLIGTLTDYHQHWVSKAFKSNFLQFGHAHCILKKFSSKNWITTPDLQAAVAAAYTS